MLDRSSLRCAALLLVGCGGATQGRGPSLPAAAVALRSVALPGAPPEGGVMLDYIAYDAAHQRVWVPAGNTGSVDVIAVSDDRVTRLEGFATQEVERKGKKRTVGPSAAAIGDGVVFIGNRGDSTVCALDAGTLAKGACAKLDAMPDGLQWVASAKELWVTTPRAKSIVILDAAKPGALPVKQTLTFEGEPEGFAVDDARGTFYTNLEDKDRTLAIDVVSRKIAHTWMPGCGEDGPKGLALDHGRQQLMVACADQVKVLDAAHDGRELSSLATGDGVDNIDYAEARHTLYAGAGRAARLTVATVDEAGKLVVSTVVATATGARNGVVTDGGAVYLTDGPDGKILIVPAPAPAR